MGGGGRPEPISRRKKIVREAVKNTLMEGGGLPKFRGLGDMHFFNNFKGFIYKHANFRNLVKLGEF